MARQRPPKRDAGHDEALFPGRGAPNPRELEERAAGEDIQFVPARKAPQFGIMFANYS